MNRILNPFEYLSTGKALGWGLAGTLFSICLLTAVSWPVGDDLSKIVTILSSNLLLWIPLSLLLYVLALLFSPSRIRAVDIFATNLFAMLPTIVILGVLSVPSKWLGGLVCEPRSACEVMKLAGYNLIVILLSVSMAWSLGLFRLPRLGQYEGVARDFHLCHLLCFRQRRQPVADRLFEIKYRISCRAGLLCPAFFVPSRNRRPAIATGCIFFTNFFYLITYW